jgi:hypothetical protein
MLWKPTDTFTGADDKGDSEGEQREVKHQLNLRKRQRIRNVSSQVLGRIMASP